jgi:hypothetical protein
MFNPLGVIDTLGEMEIEPKTGRLIVVGGYGLCSAIEDDQGNPPTLNDAIDNDGWFDDTSDGPVTAIIVFTDGSSQPAVHGWVVCTDPGYAPQTRNVNSVWDDAYNTWVQEVDLVPGLFANGAYNPDYKASFDADVLPVFHGAFLQRWNTNLPNQAIKGHETMASIQPGDDPTQVIPNFKQLLRDPNKPEEDGEGVKMPLALGDAMRSYLSLSPTQYFVLNQWYDGKSEIGAPPIGAGEKLDRSVLENLLGGRFSPGIDLTFIVRDTHLYNTQWQGETGPFRINMEALDYTTVSAGTPFLHEGYVPLRSALVEPGDLCKFMSQPWHTDYNSCATHTPDPNPAGNNTLYWSWPAQRPVNVYPKDKCNYVDGIWYLGGQAYSVRGDEGMFGGTRSDYPAQQGRYQCYFDFVMNWHKIGFVIQGLQVPDNNGGNYGSDKFIEVSSLYQDDGQLVMPWPTADEPPYTKEMRAKMNRECGPKKS